jgi:hypothetical protein
MADPTEAQEVFCEAIATEIRTGNVNDAFKVNGRALGNNRVFGTAPPFVIASPYPVIYVEWTDYAELPAMREVAWPAQYLFMKVRANIKLFTGEWDRDERIKDARILVCRLERWLSAQITLGSKVTRFTITRVSGSAESLLASGIVAQSMIECEGLVQEIRTLRD